MRQNMAPKLSLTSEQLEVICEMYHQQLEFAVKLEMLEKCLPDLTRIVAMAKPSGLLPIRISLSFLADRKRESTASELSRQLRVESSLKRTVQRVLAKLRNSQILVARPTERVKGKWGVRGSRLSQFGHLPLRYSLNRSIVDDYIMSDYVDDDSRGFFSLAEKFLLRTPGFMQATVREIAATMRMAPLLPGFLNAARKVPEIDRLVRRLGLQEPPPGYESIVLWVPEEQAEEALLGCRTFGGELPREEARRLRYTNFPTPAAWAGDRWSSDGS